MRKILIPQQEIKNRHPKGMTSYTDGDYAKFASKLMAQIEAFGVVDMTSKEQRDIAINLTMYFEDVLADAGIWRGFTDKMHEMYGKYLPFYDIDESEYFQDEPNLEDVRFIIWHTLLNNRSSEGRVANPETPALMDLAPVLYLYMQNQFEEMPVNEELKEYFEDAAFLDDFYLQRDVLKWLCYGCYLTYIPNCEDYIRGVAEEYVEMLGGQMNSAFYLSESLIPFQDKIGPLAMPSTEWLAMILRANDNEEKAAWVEEEKCLDFNACRLVDAQVGKGMTFESAEGEQFFVSSYNLNNPGANCYECDVVLGSYVRYRDEWYANADSSWIPDGTEAFEQVKRELEAKKVNNGSKYDKLLKKSGGNPFFYFGDIQSLKTFLVKEFDMPKDMAAGMNLPGKEKVALGLMGKDKAFALILKAPICLKDERNPYYDKKEAKKYALQVAMQMPEPLLKFAMEHDMLPDAALNSIHGEERGKELFRNDYDFLVRSVMREEYKG